MGKGALLLVFGASVVFTVMNLQLNKAAEQANQNLVQYFENAMAGELADQASEYLLARLADSSTWRMKPAAMFDPSILSVEGESMILYTIADVEKTFRGTRKEMIELRVDARYGRRTRTTLVYMSRQFGFVPGTLRGAITAVGSLTKTVGEIVVDGRNHGLKGGLDASDPGLAGISSGTGFRNTEGAKIGGRGFDGEDYSPMNPANPGVVEQNAAWAVGFPTTPDEALGVPDGTLKGIAQQGILGSQYVTNPMKLKMPLRGITYVDLPPGVVWRGVDLSGSGGLLIVHNTEGSARLESANTRDAAFTGLIIADRMFHIHMDILGAVMLLSPQLEAYRECRGNSDHRILFSTDAVKRATHVVLKNGTGWRGRVPVIGWRN